MSVCLDVWHHHDRIAVGVFNQPISACAESRTLLSLPETEERHIPSLHWNHYAVGDGSSCGMYRVFIELRVRVYPRIPTRTLSSIKYGGREERDTERECVCVEREQGYLYLYIYSYQPWRRAIDFMRHSTRREIYTKNININIQTGQRQANIEYRYTE